MPSFKHTVVTEVWFICISLPLGKVWTLPLTSRPLSLKNYCLSKVWFRCRSINIRVCDQTKITSNIKSWLFADQLEKPEECVLYRSRKQGGLGLVHVQFKALSLLIRTFLETAVIPKYQQNQYHVALFLWHVEGRRDITCPTQPPYYDDTFFDHIRQVKQEGLLNIQHLSSGQWYRVLMENNITHQMSNSSREIRPSRAEVKHPEVNWERTWSLATTPGLPTYLLSFLWKMIHDLLPCPARLFRLQMPNIKSDICNLCNQNQVGDLTHCLLQCPYNGGADKFLLAKLSRHVPALHPKQVVHLDLNVDDKQLPLIFLTGSVLSQIWTCRKEKRPCHLHSIRATLEANINILRKSRHKTAADTLIQLLDMS